MGLAVGCRLGGDFVNNALEKIWGHPWNDCWIQAYEQVMPDVFYSLPWHNEQRQAARSQLEEVGDIIWEQLRELSGRLRPYTGQTARTCDTQGESYT